MDRLHHDQTPRQQRLLATQARSRLGAQDPAPEPLNSSERRRVQLAFLEILQRKLEIRLAQVRVERQILAGAPQ